MPGLMSEVYAQDGASDEYDTVASVTVYPEEIHYTGEELVDRIQLSYHGAKKVTGFWGFYGRCSTLVNGTIVALGINADYHSCDGNDVYDLYENMERTNCGYDVVCYGAETYDLEGALNAVSENGTKNVYNLVIGWQGGRTGASSTYGHTCFIQGIVDGMVYFCESYGLELANTFYREGAPIVCTIAEFAEYYDKWAFFEGLVHFDYPDVVAPRMTGMETMLVSGKGFTLNFEASDNVGIEEIYAKVWRYGETEEDAVTVPVTVVGEKAWIRVNTAEFEHYDGRYYVNCYAVDRNGNVSVIGMAEDGMSLYEPEDAAGIYRVKRNNTGVHNAPYVRVNDTNTREAAINRGVVVSVTGSIVNDDGELWYLLSSGGWVNGEALRPIYTWASFWQYLQQLLTDIIEG